MSKKTLVISFTVFCLIFPIFLLGVDWTVMVYMCGDNAMNDQSYEDLEEMMQIGSTEKVKIIVQIDNLAASLEPNCRRYLIHNGSKELIGNLGEVDMADPQTLIDFVRFAYSSFEAQKYLLVLWDHGNGWPVGYYNLYKEKAIIYDQSSNNWIGVADGELKFAIDEIKKVLKKKISILGFDACLMGMVEVAFEITNGVDIMFASEEVTPWDGFPYDGILATLVNQPAVSPKDFSKRMCEITASSYNNGSQGYEPCTYSAIDLNKLTQALNNFQNTIGILSRYANSIILQQIRNEVQTFSIENNPPTYRDDYIDLIHFFVLIRDRISNQNDKEKTAELIEKCRTSILAKQSIGPYLNNANGISVWFPDNYISFKKQLSDYQSLFWQKKTGWLSFLNNYYNLDDIKPSPVEFLSTEIGNNNDFHLYWNKSNDLSKIKYDIFETKQIVSTLFDACDSFQNWIKNGFSLSSQYYHSSPRSIFSGTNNNLSSTLTLIKPISLISEGLLSFWTYYSTEETYLLNGLIKRDVFYVEISEDGVNYSTLDSFYGKNTTWTEHRYLLPNSEHLWLRFCYQTDATVSYLGVFLDDIKIYNFNNLRTIVSDCPDTTFYVFGIPQGKYYYLVRPIDSFSNKGFVSQLKEVSIINYCVPFSLPSPFYSDCKIYCDFPAQERPDLFIYTLTGDLIKKIEYSSLQHNVAYWDGRNIAGKDVAAGIYLILLKSPNFMGLGKIAKIK